MTERELAGLLSADADIGNILGIISELDLQDCWLCAGTIRNFVWNGFRFDEETDVDVVFFDPNISYEETLELEQTLRRTHPEYRWELKNQVYMHIHNPNTAPYLSATDAISKYPERCTAVAIRQSPTGRVDFFCPYGIKDILDYRVRPTDHFRANAERMDLYRQRLAKKQWSTKWPQLTFED